MQGYNLSFFVVLTAKCFTLYVGMVSLQIDSQKVESPITNAASWLNLYVSNGLQTNALSEIN